ncbi:MAG: hypothetical protein M1812_007241 [Candelaria pacifica]|nr:MAG: hypothetical protein M1812_007241 [Candelaria pacifica]
MYLHGLRTFLLLSSIALQLSLQKQVQIKFIGSTFTQRGRLVGRDIMTQTCNNAVLSDCCVALRDIMWMHKHPVDQIFYALYLEFQPNRIEITGLPDATSIGAIWDRDNQNEDPDQKGCEGRFWQYGVGPGDWQVITGGTSAFEAKWFDSANGINQQALGSDQRKVDEIINGHLPKYSDEGRGDMNYDSTSKDKGSERTFIQGLLPGMFLT